jgi:hypothetical protein
MGPVVRLEFRDHSGRDITVADLEAEIARVGATLGPGTIVLLCVTRHHSEPPWECTSSLIRSRRQRLRPADSRAHVLELPADAVEPSDGVNAAQLCL